MFKKYLMYSLGLIISLFFFNNIASANATETNQITSPSIEKQLSVYNDNVKELKHISYNQLNSIYDSGKASYIYFGRPSCPHCRDFAPVIKEVNRMKGYNIYYYNTDSSDFGPVARNLVYNIIKIPGVPTILCLKNQKIVSGWVGGGISAQELNQRLFGLDDNSNSNHQDQPSDTPVNTQAEQTSATPVNTQVKQTSATPVNTQVKQTSATPVNTQVKQTSATPVNTQLKQTSDSEKIKKIGHNILGNQKKQLPKTAAKNNDKSLSSLIFLNVLFLALLSFLVLK